MFDGRAPPQVRESVDLNRRWCEISLEEDELPVYIRPKSMYRSLGVSETTAKWFDTLTKAVVNTAPPDHENDAPDRLEGSEAIALLLSREYRDKQLLKSQVPRSETGKRQVIAREFADKLNHHVRENDSGAESDDPEL